MSICFLGDKNFDKRIVTGLYKREPSIEFLFGPSELIPGTPDPEVLEIAAQIHSVLVTHDERTMPKHFAEFLKLRNSPGIIIVPQSVPIDTAIEDLLLIWSTLQERDLANAFSGSPCK